MGCLARSSLVILCLSFVSTLCQAQSNITVTNLPRFDDVRYRALIDVLDKHLSGILIFKSMEDDAIRSVFVNEMGVTFFDATFTKNSYEFHSIMASLNKKAVKLALAKDIGMILQRGIYRSNPTKVKTSKNDTSISGIILPLQRKGYVRYLPTSNGKGYAKIENWGKKKKVITVFQNFREKNVEPDSIFVAHHNVHFTISLKQLHAVE